MRGSRLSRFLCALTFQTRVSQRGPRTSAVGRRRRVVYARWRREWLVGSCWQSKPTADFRHIHLSEDARRFGGAADSGRRRRMPPHDLLSPRSRSARAGSGALFG